MTEFTKTLARGVGYIGADTALRAYPVRSLDERLLARTAHDFIIDASSPNSYVPGPPAVGGAVTELADLSNPGKAALPGAVKGTVTAIPSAGFAASLEQPGPGGIFGITSTTHAYNSGFVIQKGGAGAGTIGHPPSEGWLDFLVMIWVQPGAVSTSFIGCSDPTYQHISNFWGIALNAGGNVYEGLGNKTIAITPALSAWMQAAVWYQFNTTTGNIYARTFYNGAEVSPTTAGTPINSTAINPMGASTNAMAAAYHAGAGLYLLGDGQNPSMSGGYLGRAERIFTGLAGHTLDPAEEVARNWAALRSWYGL